MLPITEKGPKGFEMILVDLHEWQTYIIYHCHCTRSVTSFCNSGYQPVQTVEPSKEFALAYRVLVNTTQQMVTASTTDAVGDLHCY